MNNNLRRGIETTLSVLQQRMREIERISSGDGERSPLYIEVNDLSANQREAIRNELEKIQGVTYEIKEQLSLEAVVERAEQKLLSFCTTSIVMLEEIKTRNLSRYGDIPKELPIQLDPAVDRLIAHLEAISEVMRTGRKQEG